MDREILMIAFSKTLLKLRKEKNLSQERLSYKSDLDRSNLSRIERGQYAPTMLSLFQLARGFDMEPEEIIKMVKEKYQSLKEES